MKRLAPIILCALLAGCATEADMPDMSPPPADNPPMPAGGPKWEKVDETVKRVKERDGKKNTGTTFRTERTDENGFPKMTESAYAAALDSARQDVRKSDPKLSDAEVEAEAVRRANDAKWKYEHTYKRSTSVSAEVRKATE